MCKVYAYIVLGLKFPKPPALNPYITANKDAKVVGAGGPISVEDCKRLP